MGLFAVAITHALVVAVMISAGHISGGHLNPAVTLGLLAGGHITIFRSFLYWIDQLLAASAACIILYYITGGLVSQMALALFFFFLIVLIIKNLLCAFFFFLFCFVDADYSNPFTCKWGRVLARGNMGGYSDLLLVVHCVCYHSGPQEGGS